MFLEVFFAIIIGWIIFSYYSDSNIDDIKLWFKQLFKNITHHNVSHNEELEEFEEFEDDENDEIVIEKKNNIITKSKENNHYDELLDLAMSNENVESVDKIVPKPERTNNENNFEGTIAIKPNLSESNNIPMDTNNQNQIVNNSNENEFLPSFTSATSSLEGSSLF